MKTQNICTCGHERSWHRLKVKHRNGGNQVVSLNTRSGKGCMTSGCPCKKFEQKKQEVK